LQEPELKIDVDCIGQCLQSMIFKWTKHSVLLFMLSVPNSYGEVVTKNDFHRIVL